MALLSTGLEKLVHFEIGENGTYIDGDDDFEPIDTVQFEGDLSLTLSVADDGTSTLDIRVQSSDDDDDDDPYTDVPGLAFSQVSNSSSFQTLTFNKGQCKRYITLAATTTATSSHTYSVTGVGVSKHGSTSEYTGFD